MISQISGFQAPMICTTSGTTSSQETNRDELTEKFTFAVLKNVIEKTNPSFSEEQLIEVINTINTRTCGDLLLHDTIINNTLAGTIYLEANNMENETRNILNNILNELGVDQELQDDVIDNIISNLSFGDSIVESISKSLANYKEANTIQQAIEKATSPIPDSFTPTIAQGGHTSHTGYEGSAAYHAQQHQQLGITSPYDYPDEPLPFLEDYYDDTTNDGGKSTRDEPITPDTMPNMQYDEFSEEINDSKPGYSEEEALGGKASDIGADIGNQLKEIREHGTCPEGASLYDLIKSSSVAQAGDNKAGNNNIIQNDTTDKIKNGEYVDFKNDFKNQNTPQVDSPICNLGTDDNPLTFELFLEKLNSQSTISREDANKLDNIVQNILLSDDYGTDENAKQIRMSIITEVSNFLEKNLHKLQYDGILTTDILPQETINDLFSKGILDENNRIIISRLDYEALNLTDDIKRDLQDFINSYLVQQAVIKSFSSLYISLLDSSAGHITRFPTNGNGECTDQGGKSLPSEITIKEILKNQELLRSLIATWDNNESSIQILSTPELEARIEDLRSYQTKKDTAISTLTTKRY
jgi:hypothetical protein